MRLKPPWRKTLLRIPYTSTFVLELLKHKQALNQSPLLNRTVCQLKSYFNLFLCVSYLPEHEAGALIDLSCFIMTWTTILNMMVMTTATPNRLVKQLKLSHSCYQWISIIGSPFWCVSQLKLEFCKWALESRQENYKRPLNLHITVLYVCFLILTFALC